MNKGTFAADQITENNESYDLDGMVSPNFINEGNTPVVIKFSTIQPGGQLTLNFPNHVLKGTIPIRFRESGIDNPNNRLTVYWLNDVMCN